MNISITPTLEKEEQAKKQLEQSIQRKKKILEEWMEKVETLKIELELIKNEYMVRIGYLFLKDDKLDLEIIEYKNLKKLMDEGMTYEEAKKAEEDKFYSEILRMQKEQERLEQEKSFFEKRQEVPLVVQENIKELWKKLIRKFHPDLVTNSEEKAKREIFMKKINKAYSEGDLDLLKQLEENEEIENIDRSSKEKLEEILVGIENLIQKTKQDFRDLRESEWYFWKKRKENTDSDVFADLERKLLDDIVKKIEILRSLRVEVGY